MSMKDLGARILRAHHEGRKILSGTPPAHRIYHATPDVYEPLADAHASLSADHYFKLVEAERARAMKIAPSCNTPRDVTYPQISPGKAGTRRHGR